MLARAGVLHIFGRTELYCLQTADLLWALNLPYKFTYAGFVLVCIMCAFMATTCPAPAKFMWFGELKSSVLSCVNLKILRMYPNNLGIWGAPQL